MTSMTTVFVVFAFAFAVYSCEKIPLHAYRQKPSSSDNDDLLVVYIVRNGEDIYAKCEYYSGRDQINNAIKPTKYPKFPEITTVSRKVMKNLLADCNISDNTGETDDREDLRVTSALSTTPSLKDDLVTERGIFGVKLEILPGTKWCGAGNNANSYDDLGVHNDTDSCCRTHDLCNGTLAPGETRHNLTNNSRYTSLSCECDDEFHKCLKQVNSYVSNLLGNFYFDILSRECYKEDYPRICKKHRAILGYCVEYTQVTTEPKIYQWFPAKDYK